LSSGLTTLALFLVRDRVTGPESPFTATERLVALCIGDHMNLDHEAWPSLQTIAAWTGLGMTSVRAAVARLTDGGDRVFDRERGGARPGARHEAARYRLRKPVATCGAHEPRGSAGDVEGIARRAEGYRHATQKDPVKGPVKGKHPPYPPHGGSRPEDAAFKRVYQALLDVGEHQTPDDCRRLRRQLKGGVPEAVLIEALQRQARARVAAAAALEASRTPGDEAWAWIENHGGKHVVARSAADWVIREQKPGEGLWDAVKRWAQGTPPGVFVILREDIHHAHKRATSAPEEA